MRRFLIMNEVAAPCRGGAGGKPAVSSPEEQSKAKGPRITLQDVKEFLLAYCACFLAVSVFIA